MEKLWIEFKVFQEKIQNIIIKINNQNETYRNLRD